MPDIVRYRPEDRRPLDLLYRRVFGHDLANASQLRWDWQYARNPNTPPGGLQIWLAREGPTIIGQYAAMPVRLQVQGQEIDGSWGMDVMVAPERRRQGVGETLVRTWDRHVGAAMGLGLSPASRRLFEKLRWPFLRSVPGLVKPLTRRALRRGTWPIAANRIISAVTYPYIRFVARARPLAAQIEPIRHFDERFTELWDRVKLRFRLSVRRDARYLNWRYAEPPHVRYFIAALKRDETVGGYAVYRHVQEPRGRVTLLVDFLADPDDAAGIHTILRWVDREARAADSDKIRTLSTHAGFRQAFRKEGYFGVASEVDFTVKVNAVGVGRQFYEDWDAWHVTLGDSDLDR
jgi:GNAT superfamily N-acetyltransferase